MPNYQNAVGYLLELRSRTDQNWFSAIMDLAIASDGSEISGSELDIVCEYFLNNNDYTHAASTVAPNSQQATQNIAPVFLENISAFINFKRLSPNLNLSFDKKVTLIFGKNGSGKSSLCQAMKVLSNPVRPIEPLSNARENNLPSTSFSYQFRGWQSPAVWTETVGFGSQSQFIKYFDSTVAISNTNENLDIEKSVVISVFQLELFDYVRSYLAAFQNHITEKLLQERTSIQHEIKQIFLQLEAKVNLNAAPFSEWTPETPLDLEKYLNQLPLFNQEHELKLANLENKLKHYTSASSEQGILTLKAQVGILKSVESQLIELIDNCKKGSVAELQGVEEELLNKKAALKELSKSVFPIGVNSELQSTLVKSAANITQLDNTTTCPLCLQNLNPDAKTIFIAYHKHLTLNLQQETDGLEKVLEDRLLAQQKIREFDFVDLSLVIPLFVDTYIDKLKALVSNIKAALPSVNDYQKNGNASNFSKSAELQNYLSSIQSVKAELEKTLNTATNNSEELILKTNKIKDEISKSNAHKTLSQYRSKLLDICKKATEYSVKKAKLDSQDFSTLLRNLTLKGKEAHSQLVLEQFEEKLNNEYVAMSGMRLDEIGVKLASKGSDQNITVTPNIGNSPIHRVLSEGEQKVHALSVFMAEAVTHPYQLLVFDDPVTSFDYNYTSNFCERLRNLVRSQPDTQIIVFTHSWDFFVNMQQTFNRSGLNNDLSVQVLEDCATVEQYSEKWDELCNEVETIVNNPNEPSSKEKEHLSGLLRRLLERLTNAYVFNEQRHQYKIKTLKDSIFHDFTKIVPLTMDEANELRDLYSNLSPPEHDDLRNYYSTKTKSQFKSWYDRILTVKDSVQGRRP